jgi:methionyl-tRNA synthetase
MRARLVLCLVLAVAVLTAAGCGESAKDKYISSYKPINRDLIALGNQLSKAVNTASSKSNAQLAVQFGGYQKRLVSIRKRVDGLDTPDDLKDESKALSASIDTVQEDVGDIAAAARKSDAAAAGAATVRLSRDSNRVNNAQNTLAKATGAKVGNQ